MDWSRLAGAAFDALVISFTLGAVLSPPDPFTQSLYAIPTFVVALAALSRYGTPAGRWWRRYLVFLGGALPLFFAGEMLALALGLENGSGLQSAFLLAGLVMGAWLAYFGGLDRFREGMRESSPE